MLRSFPLRTVILITFAGLVSLEACNETPSTPDLSADVFGHDGGTVTVPMKIEWGEGTFVVVPFDDPRVPESTPVENCPDGGQANPDIGLPEGFPNGGGVVVSGGDGEATHLGRLTEFSTRCAVRLFPPTDPSFVNFDLRGTLTGANGDQIHVRAEYAKTPFTPAGVPTLQVMVVGGTGRFEGAFGQLTPTQGGQVTCTDDSGLCLEGTWSGGFVEGELTIPRP